ncbi:MAG: ATPase [Bacteroides sp.]|nr:ATPase [Bacteroides sp.]
MILIADSGSTKTDWCAVGRGGTLLQRITTKGINPFFQTEEEIGKTIQDELLPQLLDSKPEAVYFYGAGCIHDKAEIVRMALMKQLSSSDDRRANIEVNTDMLAAARGLCGREAGIVCIMGTGSNSCYYDGKEIVSNVSPLGFILGDEGSGAVLGKLLVGDLLKNQLPAPLKEQFLAQFNLTPTDIIDRVYRKPFPNRFLAGLSPFLAQHLEEPSIRSLVLNSFKAFFLRNVMQYDYLHHQAHFIGSIAYHYKELLIQAAEEVGVQTGEILQSPMEGLIRYHSSE